MHMIERGLGRRLIYDFIQILEKKTDHVGSNGNLSEVLGEDEREILYLILEYLKKGTDLCAVKVHGKLSGVLS